MGYLIESIYFVATVLFIIGLKRMSHPTTARSGGLHRRSAWSGTSTNGRGLATAKGPR